MGRSGPFTFQTTRILFYLVYFFAGIGVGAWGLERGLLAAGGKLGRRWLLWLIIAVVAFLAHSKAAEAVYSQPWPKTWQATLKSGPMMAWHILFPVFCAAASFACLALFIRVVKSRIQVLDSLSKKRIEAS